MTNEFREKTQIKPKTNMDHWADVLACLPNSYKEWFMEEKRYLQKVLTPNSNVLEVGCGNGRSISDVLTVTPNVIGIDNDDRAVNEAKTNFSKESGVKIIKADATELPFGDKSFDFVICMTTFANFADKKFTILEEMKRVLKKEGKIIISVFSEDALAERMKVYNVVGIKIKEIKDGTVIFDDGIISEQFSKEQLEDIFSKERLEIDEMKKVNMAYLCTLTPSKG